MMQNLQAGGRRLRRFILLAVGFILALPCVPGCLGTGELAGETVGEPQQNNDKVPEGSTSPTASPNGAMGNAVGIAPVVSEQPTAASTDANQAVPTVISNSPVPVAGRNFSAVSMLDASSCFDVHDPLTQPSLGLYSCNQISLAQSFVLDANGVLRYADAKTSPSGGLCVEATGLGTASAGNVVLRPCTGAPAQRWSVRNGALVHLSSGLCAQASAESFNTADGIGFGRIGVAPCVEGAIQQSWWLGEPSEALTAWKKRDATSTLAEKCSPEVVLGNYVATDLGTKRLVGRYGSVPGFLQAVREVIRSNCAQMYSQGFEAPVTAKLVVNFWPADAKTITAPAWATGGSNGRSINFYTPFWATIDENEQPFTLRTDSVLHHELTHSLDWGYGKPGGIVEGYANLITYRTGYLRDKEKVKGGNWTDGYSTTAFFLKWLDDTYANKPRPQRFTDVMQTLAREQQQATNGNPDWFQPWVKAQTGLTLDQLWTRYQASF